MDPVTASILIALGTSAISTYMAVRAQNKATEAANQQRRDQEKARVDATNAEMAAASQKMNTALGTFSSKNNGPTPSFAPGTSMLGRLPSLQNNNTNGTSSNPGSAGTF